MAFSPFSQPVTVKGFPFPVFQANAEAQCPASLKAGRLWDFLSLTA